MSDIENKKSYETLKREALKYDANWTKREKLERALSFLNNYIDGAMPLSSEQATIYDWLLHEIVMEINKRIEIGETGIWNKPCDSEQLHFSATLTQKDFGIFGRGPEDKS